MKLEELNAVRIAVLERAIGALIKTHPHPGLFADVFERATAESQVGHVVDPLVSVEVKKEALDYAQDLVWVGRNEAEIRDKHAKGQG